MIKICKSHLPVPCPITLPLLLLLISLLPSSQPLAPSICDSIQSALELRRYNQLKTLMAEAQASLQEPCFIELVPKYYWAQNMTHIMVKFQFLNSADTSACDRVLSAKKEINHNGFTVALIRLQSGMIMRYRIRVQTFMALNYHHSLWREGQQNTIYLECIKSPSPFFWKSLYQASHVRPRRPKIWRKIMEKHQQTLKQFIYYLVVEDEQHDISGYVRSKKQARHTQLSQLYRADSGGHLYCYHNNLFELGSWIA